MKWAAEAVYTLRNKKDDENKSLEFNPNIIFVYIITNILLNLLPSFLFKRLLQMSAFHCSHFY